MGLFMLLGWVSLLLFCTLSTCICYLLVCYTHGTFMLHVHVYETVLCPTCAGAGLGTGFGGWFERLCLQVSMAVPRHWLGIRSSISPRHSMPGVCGLLGSVHLTFCEEQTIYMYMCICTYIHVRIYMYVYQRFVHVYIHMYIAYMLIHCTC